MRLMKKDSDLQNKFENSLTYKNKQVLEFKEGFIELQKDFLDKFKDKAANENFATVNDFYAQAFAKLKTDLYESEKDKAAARLGNDKITSADVKKKIISDYLNQIKETIEKCAIQFLDFSVKNKECLRDMYKKWSEEIFKLWQAQEKVDPDDKEYESDEKEEKDSELRSTLKKLMELMQVSVRKENLNKNGESDPDLLKMKSLIVVIKMVFIRYIMLAY